MAGVLFDLDGVLYEGERAVPGAPEAVAWFRAHGIPHLFLTNTTSRPRAALVRKLAQLGVPAREEELLTPPVAAVRWLRRHAPGPVALFVPEATAAEFAGLPTCPEGAESGAAAVVLGDLGPAWSFERLNRAFRLLMADPGARLVALGTTRYWRAPDGLRLDVGPFAHALAYATGREPVVLGKPAAPFFATALEMLGFAPEETSAIWMVGDDVVGDVGGAQRAGLRGVLVRTGKYRPGDEAGAVRPDALLASLSELPAFWRERIAR